jgi:hypothetical protein
VSLRSLARQPYAVALGLCIAIHVLGVLLAPQLWLRLSGKESVFEHLGHGALAFACSVWLVACARARRAERMVAALVSAYLAFCLLEEIDWGQVYGVNLGYTHIERWTGGPNFHNARALEHTPFGWSLPWMSAPMVLYFATGLLPRLRTNRALATRTETSWFGLNVAASVVFDGLHLLHWRLGYVPRAPAGGSLGDALGWFQIGFYVLWALSGLRVISALRRRSE